MGELYELQERVGVGSFGTVYKALSLEEASIVAIKVIDLDGSDEDLEDIKRELELLSSANNCAQLVCYLGAHVVGGQLWIATEFMEGGSLGSLGPTFDEATIGGVLKEMLRGLAYLHGERRLHRDIKAKNVLVSKDGDVKLADFGVAARLTDTTTKRRSLTGTPFFMAPEVIEQSRYDAKADVWSLGITAIELAKGLPPHSSLHPMKVLFVVPRAPAPVLEGEQFSTEFRTFVQRCTRKVASERPTAADLLADPFVQSADVDAAKRDLAAKVRRGEQRAVGGVGATTEPSSSSAAASEAEVATAEKATAAPPPRGAAAPAAESKFLLPPPRSAPLPPTAEYDDDDDALSSATPPGSSSSDRPTSSTSSTSSGGSTGGRDSQKKDPRRKSSSDDHTRLLGLPEATTPVASLRPRSEPAQKTTNSRAFRVLFAPAIATAARYAIAKGGASRRSAAVALDELCKALENVDRALPDGRLTLQLALGLRDTVDNHRASLDAVVSNRLERAQTSSTSGAAQNLTSPSHQSRPSHDDHLSSPSNHLSSSSAAS